MWTPRTTKIARMRSRARAEAAIYVQLNTVYNSVPPYMRSSSAYSLQSTHSAPRPQKKLIYNTHMQAAAAVTTAITIILYSSQFGSASASVSAQPVQLSSAQLCMFDVQHHQLFCTIVCTTLCTGNNKSSVHGSAVLDDLWSCQFCVYHNVNCARIVSSLSFTHSIVHSTA